MRKFALFLFNVAFLGQLSAQSPDKEFHGFNDFERVGSAIINMNTKKIVRFINRDSIQDQGMNELDMTTRFLTVDPMAEKYFQLSPYAYCANNPLLFVDPNGEEIWIYYNDADG